MTAKRLKVSKSKEELSQREQLSTGHLRYTRDTFCLKNAEPTCLQRFMSSYLCRHALHSVIEIFFHVAVSHFCFSEGLRIALVICV